jgi:uncharacterized membrane protein
MASNKSGVAICQACKKSKPLYKMLPAEIIRDPLVEIIRQRVTDWSSKSWICRDDLNSFRAEYIRHVLETEKGELSTLDYDVIKKLQEQELMSRDINEDFDQHLTFGERLSDKIAIFGGSWRFIITFGSVMFVWIVINSLILLKRPFDPYPFILLNLVLSCLAALQAPIIMMSQNRQESKDRLHSEHDYQINLKAELEIRNLQEKIDHLLRHQWQRLLEIQQIQMDLMEDLASKQEKR